MADKIKILGAREHNLKNLDLEIHREKITVITGVSGSGKSSLAFDTVLAEAQRRFFYTLSHYSRQFLDQGSRPNVRRIEGLSPAISLAQNETRPSRRATVGTLSDITELVNVYLARFGDQFCPKHNLPTKEISLEEITETIINKYPNQKIAIFVSVAENKKGVFKTQLQHYISKGFMRGYIDGEFIELTPIPKLVRDEKHTIKILIDFVSIADDDKTRKRLSRSLQTAFETGQGYAEYFPADKNRQINFSSKNVLSTSAGCKLCGFSWPKLDSRYFNANSLGKCKSCDGYGSFSNDYIEEQEEFEEISEPEVTCEACRGSGIMSDMDFVRIGDKSAIDLQTLPLRILYDFFNSSAATTPNLASQRVREEILGKIKNIIDIGLNYLSLSRRVLTLSGGESQRLKLAGILTENLRGVLYILDEPSQGLHPSELHALCKSLVDLRDNGNTIIIVDHDDTIMNTADQIIDLGPGGGALGGKIISTFSPQKADLHKSTSKTAAYLAQHNNATFSCTQKTFTDYIEIKKPRINNLKIDNAKFPKNALTVITGVSGAGKSSLILDIFCDNMIKYIESSNLKKKHKWRFCDKISGFDNIRQIYLVDRKPISKSGVSIPASYLGAFKELRELYGNLPESQLSGLTPRAFSLSVEGGRCQECKGRGQVTISMKFLADAKIECPICFGKRYNSVVTEIRYLNHSMSDVLELTIDEAIDLFKNHKRIIKFLKPAAELGLGYLKMGQPSSSLSGGEAQRLKLVPYVNRQMDKDSCLILDEPTTGLHFEDVKKLIKKLRDVCANGTSVIIIEHNAEVICAADWIVDLGPGAADLGGEIVFQGIPEKILSQKNSLTGRHLTNMLTNAQRK